jgi:hypothetical protein
LAIAHLQVDPGRTLTVKSVDSDGKPISRTMAAGLTVFDLLMGRLFDFLNLDMPGHD